MCKRALSCSGQVQRTTDNMAAASRQAWRATRWTTKRAMKGPSSLLHMVTGSHRERHIDSDEEFYSDEESRHSENMRALLSVR